MPFILRADIDKPYGHHSLLTKAMSKCREDYYFPALDMLHYLKPTIAFLKFCNENNVPSFLYFRNCTAPNDEVNVLLKQGGHTLGFHAENTRSIETFKDEVNIFEIGVGEKVHFFTKHGSGKLKLGRYHYAPYEPETYKIWARELNFNFSLGNGIASCVEDLRPTDHFYSSMFWLEHDYRNPNLNRIEDLVDFAKNHTVPLIVHPDNFYTYPAVKNDLQRLFDLSKKHDISWLDHIT